MHRRMKVGELKAKTFGCSARSLSRHAEEFRLRVAKLKLQETSMAFGLELESLCQLSLMWLEIETHGHDGHRNTNNSQAQCQLRSEDAGPCELGRLTFHTSRV